MASFAELIILLAIVNLWSVLQLLNKFDSGLQNAQMLRLDAIEP